jgi:hypothetical protein
MAEPRIVLAFDSIHDVIRAEKILKEEGISCSLIPAPREIRSDCGMAIEVPAREFSRIEALQESLGASDLRQL